MSDERKPAAFDLGGTARAEAREAPARAPRAIRGPDLAAVRQAAVDVFDAEDAALTQPPLPKPRQRGAGLGTILTSALGILLSLAVGLWTDRLIRDLFERADWLGWAALAVAAVAALAFVAIVTREALALSRLASVEHLRERTVQVAAAGDTRSARKLVDEVTQFVSAQARTAAGRRALDALRNDVIDAPDLLRLAEIELMGPLDRAAQQMILDAGKRVSVVTAVSPRAVVDLAYVLFESGRLIRRLSELYGGRPGTLGFLRLARSVLAHLAVTGTMAAGDEVVHQIVGQGLAARLSARLGEGVVNGMMTVRIGLAAMDTVRPMPFAAVKRPGLGDFLAAIARFSRSEAKE